ncbi:TVP38/TMEM64 family protein [Aneurinibacillus sp. BA2021]|nr:TVP38/TMEM64 family protein [Aneurinibacillus sp. BA2021]
MKRLLVSSLVLVAVIYLVMQTTLGQLIRTGNLEQAAVHIQSYGWIAVLVSVVAVAVQTFVPVVPFALLAGANVLAFGLWPGFFVSWLGAFLAALLNFLLARYVGREWAERKIGHHSFMKKLNRYAETRGFIIILLARFIPVMPSSVVNTAAGISSISFGTFLFATLLGKGPAVFFESVLGHFLLDWKQHKEELLLLLLGAGLMMLGVYYVKKKKSTLL